MTSSTLSVLSCYVFKFLFFTIIEKNNIFWSRRVEDNLEIFKNYFVTVISKNVKNQHEKSRGYECDQKSTTFQYQMKSFVSGEGNCKGSITMSEVLQHHVLTLIVIQLVTVAVLNVVIKGVIFICSNCGLRLSHFNTHIQFSEEQ